MILLKFLLRNSVLSLFLAVSLTFWIVSAKLI